MQPRVAAFTDTYLPTVNGVTYTVRTWRERWSERGGQMDVVYPRSPDYESERGEHPVRSVDFPFYQGYRLAVPYTPGEVVAPDVVHSHSPFSVGVAGYRYARSEGAPFVVSYHTPTSEYVEYLAPDAVTAPVERGSAAWERWFLDRADLVLAPSERTRTHVEELGVSTSVIALPNGVDVEFFSPTDPGDFLAASGLDGIDAPLVGYTGRHGYEKRLLDLVDAAVDLDVTLVFGGDGPAREDVEARADELDVDARFLGFLDREDLPAFYTALDVFAFPSPVETQGIVALEANACGTPVVGANAGALSETVVDGETGYHFPVGDVTSFGDAIDRALADERRLSETCLDRRDAVSVERSIDRLEVAYDRVLQN